MVSRVTMDRMEQLEEELKGLFEHWYYMYEYGGSDPFWTDGVNLNLVRNHVIYCKREMEDLHKESQVELPIIYFEPLPKEVDSEYMARAEEIRSAAREALKRYQGNDNLNRLMESEHILTKEQVSLTCIVYVTGYYSGLRWAIESDDLITMRRHARGMVSYEDSFKQ